MQQGNAVEAQAIIDATRANQLSAMLELFAACRKLFADLRRGILMIVEQEDQLLGLLVDVVNEVMTLRPEQIEELPVLTSHNSLVTGLARCNGRLIQLLSVERIVRVLDRQAPAAVC